MPVGSYLELSTPRHVKLTTSAGEHTRYVRLAAQIAPYINDGVSAAPRLGWKSPALSTEARLIAPIYGILNGLLPNRR
jgi:hypothetical protein